MSYSISTPASPDFEENKRADRPWVRRTQIGANIAVILRIALFFIGHMFLWWENRRERAVDFVSRFQSERAIEARFTILSFWQQQSVSQLLAKGGDLQTIRELAFQFLKDDESQGKTAHIRAVLTLNELYGDVGYCKHAGLCDPPVVDQLYRDAATDFICTYRPYLLGLEKRTAFLDLLKGTELLVGKDHECITGR